MSYPYVKEPLAFEGAISQVYGLPLYEQVDLQQQMMDAYAAGERRFRIPRGAYRLTPDAVAHLHLDGMHDFSVEGEGVILLCQDLHKSGVLMEHCDRVRLSGITVDFEPCGYTQGILTRMDEDSFDIFVEEGYLADIDDYEGPYLCPCDFFDRDTKDLIRGMRGLSGIPDGSVEDLGNRTFRIHIPLSTDQREGLKVGDFFIITRRPIMKSAYTLVDNAFCQLQDCTAWAGLCGVAESFGRRQTVISNFQVVPGPAPYGAKHPRVLSTVADACHMACNCEGAKIEHSTFASCGDDCLNHYGYFSCVAEQVAPDTVIFAEACDTPLKPGERLRLYQATTEKIGEAVVLSCEKLSDYQPPENIERFTGANTFRAAAYFKVTLDRLLSTQTGDWMSNTNRCGNGFLFRHNTVKNVRPRGCLIKASDGLIEDNTFYNIGYAGVQIRPEFDWLEAGYSHRVTVRNNRFIHCGNPDTAALMVSGQRAWDQKDIVIKGNTFIHCPAIEVSLAQVDSCTVRDNVFGVDRDTFDHPMLAILCGTNICVADNTFPEACVPVATSSLSD